MATFTKLTLSGANAQNFISLSPGVPTAVHQTSTTAGVLDELWVYVSSQSTTDVDVWVQIANFTTFVAETISKITLAPKATTLVIPGIPYGRFNSGNGNEIRLLSPSAVLFAFGYVNRITP